MQLQSLQQKNYLVQNINSAMVEKLIYTINIKFPFKRSLLEEKNNNS